MSTRLHSLFTVKVEDNSYQLNADLIELPSVVAILKIILSFNQIITLKL